MQNQSIALAIITYYPKWYKGKLKNIRHTDKIRGNLALQLIKASLKKGLQVVDVDGQSSVSFQKELSFLKNLHVVSRRGKKRSPAKRQAFLAASKLPGVKTIIATEAEKVSLITDCLDPILAQKTDIIIPKRNEELFKKTYPPYQYRSESEGNTLYNEVLKAKGILPKSSENFDFLFGPRVFKNKPEILKLFLSKYLLPIGDPEQFSNSVFFPVILALKKGYRVVSVEVPFRYPKTQKANEEYGQRHYFVQKRRIQRETLLEELKYFVNSLKNKKML